MSLNHGRSLLAIPGPSVIPDRVLTAMHRPSPNIYEGELIELTHSLIPDLKRVARTDGDVAIYIANGHGAWEAAIKNTLNPGDKVLVLSTGRFAHNWGVLGSTHGLDITEIDFGMQSDVDLNKAEEALRADTKNEFKAVLMVQTDTSTSVKNDVEGVRKVLDATGHDALFMVDCIASLGCDRFEMDAWGVDVMVTACQKGLMTPAGLSFVYFNDKASKARASVNPGEYWDWVPRTNVEIYYQYFDGTAPTHHLYGLREALDMLVNEEGMENVWARHETFAKAYWAALDAWNVDGSITHNIKDPAKRSNAVSAIVTGPEYGGKIRRWCEEEAGVTLGIGLGLSHPGTPMWDRCFRIGHMGHQNVVMMMGVLGSMQAAMAANDIPHGSGAIEAAAHVIAEHDGG